MSTALTGKDTVILTPAGGAFQILKDLANGDTVNIDYANNLIEAVVGKNGNTIFAFNSTGKTVIVTIRIILGSTDDKFFNNQLNLYLQDQAAYPLITGEFIKRVGDGAGNVSSIVYKMDGGAIQKMPVVKENVEGDIEQAVTIWTMVFANTSRIIA